MWCVSDTKRQASALEISHVTITYHVILRHRERCNLTYASYGHICKLVRCGLHVTCIISSQVMQPDQFHYRAPSLCITFNRTACLFSHDIFQSLDNLTVAVAAWAHILYLRMPHKSGQSLNTLSPSQPIILEMYAKASVGFLLLLDETVRFQLVDACHHLVRVWTS